MTKKMDGPKNPSGKKKVVTKSLQRTTKKFIDEPKRIESKKPKSLTMIDSTLYKAKKSIKEGDFFGGISMAKKAYEYDQKGMSDKDILKDKLSGTPWRKKVMPRPEPKPKQTLVQKMTSRVIKKK